MSDFSGNRVFGLDLLRALSILCVLFSHGSGFLLRENHFLYVPVIYAGFIGVEFFFVLSGFLVGSIAYRLCLNGLTRDKIINFWIRRWFRTLPNYYLFLLINLILLILGGYNVPFENQIINYFQVLLHVFFMQNFIDYAPSVFFGESWSLAIEEWFYLLIMLFSSFFLVVFKSPKKSFCFAALMLILFPLSLRIYYVLNFDINWLQTNRTVLLHLDSIAWGVVGAIVIDRNLFLTSRLKQIYFAIGLIILFIASFSFCYLLFYNRIDSSFFGKTFLYTLVSLAVLMMFPKILDFEFRPTIFRKIVTSISLWSYSLYLINLPVFYLIDGISELSVLTKTIAFICLSLSFSAVIYKFFEAPITRSRQRFSY